MSVPAKRVSKRRTRARRSHHALTTVTLATCSQCRQPMRPHYACPSCGFYRGRDVLKRAKKVERKLEKKSRAASANAS